VMLHALTIFVQSNFSYVRIDYKTYLVIYWHFFITFDRELHEYHAPSWAICR